MKVVCRFCDFYRVQELSKPILDVIESPEMPAEDIMIWTERLIKQGGTKAWSGVKVHMGRMHKDETYYGIWPELIYSEEEMRVFNSVASRVSS